ncbi:hypothetical protein KCU71_g16745, partial [Aureobasidium melanogenum]
MATSKSFLVLIMLVFQLLCLGYLAHGSSGTVVPHEFSVLLAENHTLASHFEYMGKKLNISSYHELTNVYHIDFYNTTRTHDLSEEAILDLIRSDPNVDGVEPNMVFSLDGF